MGMLLQGLAGAVSGGADSITKSLTTQEQNQHQMLLEQAREQHQEHLLQLQNQMRKTGADSGMVDSTGRPLTVEQLDALTDKSDVQNAAVYTAENSAKAKANASPVAQDTATGMLFFPGDTVPDKPSIRNLSKEEGDKAAADLNFRNQQADEMKSKSEYYRGGGRGPQVLQSQLDAIDEMDLPEDTKKSMKAAVITKNKTGFGPDGQPVIKSAPITSAAQEKIDALEENAQQAYSSGNKQAGDDILTQRNQYAKRYGLDPVEYVQDKAPTTEKHTFGSDKQVQGSGHLRAKQTDTPKDTQGSKDNNPMNLTDPSTGKPLSFSTPEDGMNANYRQLKKYADNGKNTIRDIISTWAPPNENDTENYIKNVSQWTGIKPDEKIDINNPQQVMKLMQAMTMQEKGQDAAAAFYQKLASNSQTKERPPLSSFSR